MSTDPSVPQNQVRYKNHRERFLAELDGGGWVECSVFTDISRNHTARIAELRNLGYNIEIQHVDNGDTRYRLAGKGEPVTNKSRKYSADTIIRWVEVADLEDLRRVRDAVNAKLRTLRLSQ